MDRSLDDLIQDEINAIHNQHATVDAELPVGRTVLMEAADWVGKVAKMAKIDSDKLLSALSDSRKKGVEAPFRLLRLASREGADEVAEALARYRAQISKGGSAAIKAVEKVADRFSAGTLAVEENLDNVVSQLAEGKGLSYTVTVKELGTDRWAAAVSGKGTEYLSGHQKSVTAGSGHEALATLAKKWSNAGFAE
jgi:hypothetical protein